jgi:hypothetical protein
LTRRRDRRAEREGSGDRVVFTEQETSWRKRGEGVPIYGGEEGVGSRRARCGGVGKESRAVTVPSSCSPRLRHAILERDEAWTPNRTERVPCRTFRREMPSTFRPLAIRGLVAVRRR